MFAFGLKILWWPVSAESRTEIGTLGALVVLRIRRSRLAA